MQFSLEETLNKSVYWVQICSLKLDRNISSHHRHPLINLHPSGQESSSPRLHPLQPVVALMSGDT